MKQYKVWVEVEEYDSKTEEYQDAPSAEPVGVAAGLTFKEATAVVRRIAESFADPDALAQWKREGIYPFTRRKK